MKVTLTPASPRGRIKAIASKSAAHRLLICAAFADGDSHILCEEINRDIEATTTCLCALGATILREGAHYHVTPIKSLPEKVLLPCGESGSTLRFLVPIVAALGIEADFVMEGRLPQRPLSPLREELEAHGILFSPIGSNPLHMSGQLSGRCLSILGNVSSQFISGLLFALSVSKEGGVIDIAGQTESAPYLAMTCDALSLFGVPIEKTDRGYRVPPVTSLHTPHRIQVEGDWSNAAFPLCAGAIAGDVAVYGLDLYSHQGDREIISLLRRFGARVETGSDSVRVCHAPLHAITIDASQIPDLVPILAVVASVAEGTTVIRGAARLRIKESDRLRTVTETLGALGVRISETEDGLIICGSDRPLSGGCVSACGDHRIAMSAAVAAQVASAPVTITNAEAVEKSYPAFWQSMQQLGSPVVTPDEA